MQINSAVADSLGICVFGRSVTDVNLQLIADAINNAFDIGADPDFVRQLGIKALKLEAEFNRKAGFTEEDDELPSFFMDEALPPTGKKARLTSAEVNRHMSSLLAAHPAE
jgi:aldehyde:ferredoxin oxidoreductase